MTEHIDIPLETIDALLANQLAGKYNEVMGGLMAIHDLLRNPNVQSNFEMNSTMLIHHQMNRIAELESAAELLANDVDSDAEKRTVKEIVTSWQQWAKDSNARYQERIKDLVQK